MLRLSRVYLPFILLLAAVLIFSVSCTMVKKGENETAESVAPEVGKVAPDFQLRDINNESVSLSGFEGEPVLLVFWISS